jgi:dTDP-glucose 4,6-dehydratase
VSKVIHTSTSEVYGSAQFVPITEAHPLQGQSPYSATKIAADQLAYSFACSFETPVVTVRPFNTFGPRQSLRAVIPAIITQIAAGSRLLRLGALKPTRDFSYVNDTVRGFLSAWKSELPAGQVVNLGSNFEISIGDTVDQIADLMGAEVEVEADSDRFRPEDSEVERLWADNSLARELLGWEPEHQGRAGFRRALEKTIEWFKDTVNLTRYGQDSYVL